MYALAQEIEAAYENGQTRNILIYGEPGVGKSVYAIKLLKELNADDPDPLAWRKYIVFTAEDFIKLCRDLLDHNRRVKAIIFDDAGVALHNLDWNSPKVKSVMKMLQVSRPITGAMIFTAPAAGVVLKGIRNLEGILITKIVRRSTVDSNLRIAKTYRNTIAAFGKRYTKQKYEDTFNVMLPDEDYNWYFPMRLGYVDVAANEMEGAFKVRRQYAKKPDQAAGNA